MIVAGDPRFPSCLRTTRGLEKNDPKETPMTHMYEGNNMVERSGAQIKWVLLWGPSVQGAVGPPEGPRMQIFPKEQGLGWSQRPVGRIQGIRKGH